MHCRAIVERRLPRSPWIFSESFAVGIHGFYLTPERAKRIDGSRLQVGRAVRSSE
jgi:hypothetical protein